MLASDVMERYNGWPNRETCQLVTNLTNDQYLEGRSSELAILSDERAHIEFDDLSRRSPKSYPEEAREAYVAEQSAVYFSEGVHEMLDEFVKLYSAKHTDKVSESCREFMVMLMDVGSSWRIDWRSALEAFLG
jgi:hypothetical protein